MSIQDEDESLLRDTSKKELDIKHELNCELLTNSENKSKIQELTYIQSIKNSKIKFIYFLLPLVEVPIAIVIFLTNIIASATILTGTSINLIAGILLLDCTHNISVNYKKVSNMDSTVKGIVKTLKTLFMNKKKFAKELEYYLEIDELSDHRISELTKELNETKNKKESLIEEIENLEGYILGVQKIIRHNLLENVPDSNLAVEFVNLRLNKKSSH